MAEFDGGMTENRSMGRPVRVVLFAGYGKMAGAKLQRFEIAWEKTAKRTRNCSAACDGMDTCLQRQSDAEYCAAEAGVPRSCESMSRSSERP